jgi:hypothetical protein
METNTVDSLLTDPHGTWPGSDNLQGRLKRALIKMVKINIEL